MIDAHVFAQVAGEFFHPVFLLDGIAGKDQLLTFGAKDGQQHLTVAVDRGLLQGAGGILGRIEDLLV